MCDLLVGAGGVNSTVRRQNAEGFGAVERQLGNRFIWFGTAHFTIGSGTRLALEDAIALAKAIQAQPDDLGLACDIYKQDRAPALDKLLAAADASAAWYENFQEHMKLAPYAFAMSYINRTGRVDRARLKAALPAFVARYEEVMG